MDKLLQPDTGLIIWTVITFLGLVFVLARVGWKPILEGINRREEKIRGDLSRAEKAQADAELLRRQYETRLAETERIVQGLINQARLDGEKLRADLAAQAREESEKILKKGQGDLAAEAEKLKNELRTEVAQISIAVAEKVLQRNVDRKIHDEILSDSLKNYPGVKS